VCIHFRVGSLVENRPKLDTGVNSLIKWETNSSKCIPFGGVGKNPRLNPLFWFSLVHSKYSTLVQVLCCML
jgi:hypothetical protein